MAAATRASSKACLAYRSEEFMVSRIDVPVLIVGAGPVGMMGAILLHQLGVEARLIDRRAEAGRAPAAHVVNARTFEICRSAGVDMDALGALTGDPADAGQSIWMTRLAGEALMSLPFERQDDSVLALTPTPLRNLGQHHFERILGQTLASKGAAKIEFGMQWESAEQHEDAVVSRVRDLSTNAVQEIRSEFVIAADGAGSRIRESLGIEMIGPPKLQSFVMIHFEADLREIVKDHPGILYWISDPEAGGTFVAHDIDREWVYMSPFDSDAERAEDYTPERCKDLVLRAIGGPAPPIKVETISTWTMSAQVAERFRDDRIFLVGDAAHRFPPTGGLGLNSGVQDVHGLAWRIAGVRHGWASDRVLDSYEAERRPVAQYNADQSLRNAMKLIEVPAALGILEDPTTARMQTTLDDPAGRQRTIEAIANQAEHFDMLGLQLGFRYEKGAVIPDGSAPPEVGNPVREYVPTSRPGARLPHAWVEKSGRRVSTLDLIKPGSFTLLTSKPSEIWADAVKRIDGVPLEYVAIGRDAMDSEGLWARVSGIEPDGALLIRPDQHVGWRATSPPDDPAKTLNEAVTRILTD
jgi:2,4-dichlorophenol 6-monooxygenase